MIEAIIHYQDSTLIMDLPRNIYDIHEKLMSIGCPTAPGRIPLTDNEDDALRVKLYGRIEISPNRSCAQWQVRKVLSCKAAAVI